MLAIKFLICDNETWGSDDWGVGSVDWCKDIWGEEFDRVIGSLLAAAADEELGSSFGPWNDILNETREYETRECETRGYRTNKRECDDKRTPRGMIHVSRNQLKWIDENECKKRKEYENENEDRQSKSKKQKTKQRT